MCELLVCVKNIGVRNILSWDCRMPKQGDVITIHDNGWVWSANELGQGDHPNYAKHNFLRIMKLPNVTIGQASRLLTSEPDVDPAKPSPYLQYRAFYIDKTKLPIGALLTHLLDDLRATGFISSNILASQLNNYITQRTPIPF